MTVNSQLYSGDDRTPVTFRVEFSAGANEWGRPVESQPPVAGVDDARLDRSGQWVVSNRHDRIIFTRIDQNTTTINIVKETDER